jgi:threonine dehydratase
MRFLFERAKLVVEGAGAATTAALLAGKVPEAQGQMVAIVSGGNLDLARLREILPGSER